MQDQINCPDGQDITCLSETHFTQDHTTQEQFYEILTIGQLKGFKDSFEFILPFTLFYEEIQEDSQGVQSQPLNFTHIQSFQDFQFDFVRASDKFGFEIHLYIFYNMGDKKRQLQSAIKLYSMGMQLHRELLIWVKCSRRGHWSYFDTQKWKNKPLPCQYRKQEYFNLEELKQALRQL